MGFNGSGSYVPPAASYPPITKTLITIAKFTALIDDIVTALSNGVQKDGQTTVTANLPMSTFKLTGLGVGTALTDSVSVVTMMNQTGLYVKAGAVGGTGDATTLTPVPAITAYVDGMSFAYMATNANTTATTVNVSGLGAKTIKKGATADLAANDILASAMVTLRYNGTNFMKV